MSYRRPLAERERALEDAFFQKETRRLLEAMHERQTHEEQFEALSRTIGISDTKIVEPLLELGLRESNFTALVMAPLISVAWADNRMEKDERRLIARSAEELGIEAGSDGAQLLDLWLEHRPHESLLDAWSAYVHELCAVLDESARERLRDDIVSRAKLIARGIAKSFLRASGPTEDERDVIKRIEETFETAGKKGKPG